jgi:DNA-binding PadR family transcriptional regulator
MDVKTLCLGALTFGDATGYEIKKQFEEGVYSHLHHAGFGSIYPALSALSDVGLVTCTEFEQEGRPDKKIYHITAAGTEALRMALHAQPAPDKLRSEHLVMLLFADLLDPVHRRRVFERYLERFQGEVARLRDAQSRDQENADMPAGCRFVQGFGLAVYEAAARYMEENDQSLFEDAAQAAPGNDLKTGTSG